MFRGDRRSTQDGRWKKSEKSTTFCLSEVKLTVLSYWAEAMKHVRFGWLIRLAKEPLVHFVIVGAAIFVLHAALRPTPELRRIEVSEPVVQALTQDHVRRTGTPPTDGQVAALVEQFVDDEVLFREALALGLDRGDPVVRRRLIQKMRFLTEDIAPVPEPHESELEAYLGRHEDRYRRPEELTLRQVYVGFSDGAVQVEERAEQLLRALQSGVDPNGMGDPFLHGSAFESIAVDTLDRRFGPGFAASLAGMPSQTWVGPVESAYGLHLVWIESRRPSRAPTLAEVVDAVRRDWLEEQRAETNREALDRLREGYDIEMVPPSGASTRELAASTGDR